MFPKDLFSIALVPTRANARGPEGRDARDGQAAGRAERAAREDDRRADGHARRQHDGIRGLGCGGPGAEWGQLHGLLEMM